MLSPDLLVRAFFLLSAGSEDPLNARAAEVHHEPEFAHGQVGGVLELVEHAFALNREVRDQGGGAGYLRVQLADLLREFVNVHNR